MTPAVKVGVVDSGGNLDPYTLYTDATLSIGTNPVGGTLTGGGSQPLTAGVATFSGLKIDKSGTGYTLKATSTPAGLTVDEQCVQHHHGNGYAHRIPRAARATSQWVRRSRRL